MARPGKYERCVAPRLLEIGAWARDGLIDEDIAHNLGVAVSTFNNYKRDHPELAAELAKSKAVADIRVENELYRRACGYRSVEQVKERRPVLDPITGETSGQLVVIKEVEKEIPPDTTAQIFWLKNRKPAAWRDKQDLNVESDGGIKIDILDWQGLDD